MYQESIKAMRSRGEGLSNDGQIWTDGNKKVLIALFTEGIGISEIAVRMGRSEPAIVQQLIKDHMFEYETKQRACRGRTPHCRCPQCEDYRTCHRSPLNHSAKEDGADHV